jgi:hypothetical protein
MTFFVQIFFAVTLFLLRRPYPASEPVGYLLLLKYCSLLSQMSLGILVAKQTATV